MKLSRKVMFHNDTENLAILNHMGYSAYKLWNKANYEKRNYKDLKMSAYPNWYEQKKRLKDNFFYRNLPAQTAQEVLSELERAWKSYFKLCKTKGIVNPRPPRFKHENMGFSFLQKGIQQTSDGVRLSISKQLKDYLKTQCINANYIYLKTDNFSDINIKQIQIRFIDEKTFSATAVYEIEDIEPKDDNGHCLSIDLGLKNNFTCYDSNGQTFIIRGFMEATHYYDKCIAYYQSINSSMQYAKEIQYPKTSKRIKRLYIKKRNKVNNFVHQATKQIANYCERNDIRTVVVGDIRNIRKEKNIGRNNQQLHSFPYEQIYQKLKYKLELKGIQMIKQNEAYSSQCPPDSKSVSKEYAIKINRKYRGLYISDRKKYNADCVGAYNILRLYKPDFQPINLNCLSSPRIIHI